MSWGGKDIAGSFSALDAALIDDLSANRLAGIPASKITFERSSDAGSTWTTYNGNADLVTTSGSASNSNTTSSQSVNNWHRITIDVSDKIYCELRKIAILLSTNGATGCKCKIEWGDYSSTTVWTTEKTVSVRGWSGWNIINVEKTIGSSTYGKIRYVRLTFSQTGVNASYPSNLPVMKIRFYSNNCWNQPSSLAANGHVYSYDSNFNVTFPAKVTATTFDGKATKDGNGNTITSTYIKGLSASGQTITYTKGDGSTGTITTQDTKYSAGTHISIDGTTINASWPTASDSGYAGINKTGTVTGVKVNGTTKSPTDGIVDIGSIPSVVQTTGTSTTNVISQNSVTNELNKKADLFVKETVISQIGSGKSYELGNVSSMTNFPTINAAEFTSINDVSQICFKASANFAINMPSTTYLCIGDGLGSDKTKLTTVSGKSYCITVGYTPFGIQIVSAIVDVL